MMARRSGKEENMVSRRRRPVLTTGNEGAIPEKELVLYPNRKNWLLVFLGCLGFCAASVFVLPRREFLGWLGLGLFGSGATVSLMLVLFPKSSYLRLTSEGFHMKSLIRTHFTAWRDVASFSVASMSMYEMVVFNYSPSYGGHKLGRKLAGDLTGSEGALGDTYGMSAHELAETMNQWKARSEMMNQHAAEDIDPRDSD
jgi:hypothetical protein